MSNPETTFSGVRTGLFPTTRWTLVVAAGRSDPESRRALESMCESYWYPVYACVRRYGHTPEAAQDLTQSFFVTLLSGALFARADKERGSFRAYLVGALKYFLSDQADRERALKRGGGAIHLPFNTADGETLYQREPAHSETPERIFERRWALTVLERALNQLRQDFIRSGRLDHFRHLQPYLTSRGDVPYAELAKKLEVSEGALKTGIHRLRKRYRDALRAEVAATVADDSQIDAELRFLISAMRPSRA